MDEAAAEVREGNKAIRRTNFCKSARFPRVRKYSYTSPEKLEQLERGFLLDGVALSKLANDDIGRSQPSLNIGIPQYSALNDPNCKKYFTSKGLPNGVNKYLSRGENAKKNRVQGISDSMIGAVFDQFVLRSPATKYLEDRTLIGAGYTRKLYGGHLTVPTALPLQGYNGEGGYRRNTPFLRLKRSPFECEDYFDNPKYLSRHKRVQSAPATMRLTRQKSAKIYSQKLALTVRPMTALPQSVTTGDLSTGQTA